MVKFAEMVGGALAAQDARGTEEVGSSVKSPASKIRERYSRWVALFHTRTTSRYKVVTTFCTHTCAATANNLHPYEPLPIDNESSVDYDISINYR